MLTARFRIPKLCIYLLIVYSFVSVFHFYNISKPEQDLIYSNLKTYEKVEFTNPQPQLISAISETNILPVTYFSSVIVVINSFRTVRKDSSYFLLKVQKAVQYPSCKTLYLLIRVLIH